MPKLLGLAVLLMALLFSGSAVYAQETQPPRPTADLGDAPDSTNHHSISNTAYSGVPGRFPTVFNDTPAGEGRGPIHYDPHVFWLGDKVSLENEADTGPDQEMDAGGNPINNILAKAADNADNDRADDGWLNRNVPLADCKEAILKVRVRKDPAIDIKKAFLNVWIDGNRDGDWEDIGKCDPDGHSNEWIVQDFAVDLSAMTGSFADIEVKTILVYNAKPDAPAWMRFTLSEEMAEHMPPVDQPNPNEPPTRGLTDGRGPHNGFRFGETEDYLRLPDQVDQVKPDFGDAPDSSNHHSLANVAYPSVPTNGRFPSVWEGTAAGAPSGPMHANPYASWLGDRVSSEKDADLLPDMDPTTNILNNGTDANASNQDEFDDGWRNFKQTRFIDCEETTLLVRVSRNPSTPGGKMYLNVYYDGDRSGDWRQRKICQTANADPVNADYAHEWIVENFVIDTSVIVGSMDIPVTTMKVMNNQPTAPAWVRFTLSEEPVTALAPFEHDGRGPDWPKGYRFGETEDYLHQPNTDQGQPGDLQIRKYHSETDNLVTVGDTYTYTVEIAHVGGTAPATAVMSDRLPAEVQLVSGPFVTLLAGNATPLAATFDSGVPPSGEVSWAGYLDPDSKLRIEMVVLVRQCPPQDRQVIHNVARLFSRDGRPIAEAEANLKTNCERPKPPVIHLEKKLIRLSPVVGEIDIPDQPEADQPILAGQEVAYGLNLNTESTIAGELVISDSMPVGVVATQISVDRGEATIRDDGRLVIWRLRVGPDSGPAHARIHVKPNGKLKCNEPVVNIAHWIFYHGNEALLLGQSNPARIYLVCADLGDAPDSSNHAGMAMDAYVGVPGARFPTVFNVAAPERGPKHMITRPFHLGRGVTEEREADLGVDQDPTNNILPKLNQPDKDERDDGLVYSELKLEDCKVARIPVLVSIDATALAALTAVAPNAKPVGYVNVWLDSNRDGDWVDHYECPGDNQAKVTGWEHIVVDHPVDVAALGPGIHKIYLTTNWPVSWPLIQGKEHPAWMRITLAETVSNKVLDCGAGTCHIGDGRGYDKAFRFGETEDYLVRSHSDQPGEGADPSVRKEGRLSPERDPSTGNVFWLAQWSVRYKNLGHGLATNVVVTDELSGPQTLDGERSVPVIPPTISGNSLRYAVGNLGPGAEGHIGLRSILPIDTAPGTIITNTVTITADLDLDPTNNTTVVTLTVPLLPPLITYPTPGTTCTGTFTITGRVQPGATVDLTIVDSNTSTTVDSATVSPDSSGHWTHAVSGLPDGEYDINATAMLGGVSSPTTTVHVIVDSSLFWNPLSLRFTDGDGHVSRPHDANGRTDEDGWSVFLRRGTVYTASLTICCDDPNAVVTLELGTVASLTLTDPDGDGTYTATFTTPSTGPITGRIRICVVCHLIKVCSDGEITIDPEGTVFDITTGLPVSSSAVACMAEQVSGAGGESVFGLWPAADFGQINPQTTGSDGYFSFFTPAGTYQLQVSKSGYQAYRSQDLVVTNAPVHFDVPLTPAIAGAASHTVLITAEGFDPSVLTVEPGATVEFVNMDVALHSSRSTSPAPSYGAEAAELKSSDAWDSGLLDNGASYKRTLTSTGTYTYADAVNPAVTATIIVEEAAAPQINLYLPAVVR
ncbi:MAG: hypothetical protein KF753_19930 [Caldilineaceae bacterium]|nr:hypothetical protein [Caldilineaceae bacterium]